MNSQGYKVKQYLELTPVYFVRHYTLALIFMSSIFAFLVINYLNDLGIPQKTDSLKNMVFLLISGLISLIGIYILINAKKALKLYILFAGITCLYLSIFFMEVYYEFMYLLLKVKTPLYMIFAVIGLASILFWNFYFLKRALNRGDFRKGVINNKFAPYGRIAFFLIPYFIGKGLSGMEKEFLSEKAGIYIFAFVLLIFAYIWTLGVHFIYKYYLIKKYEDYVDQCILPHVFK